MNGILDVLRTIDVALDNFIMPIFVVVVALLHVFYFFVFLEIVKNKIAFLDTVNTIIQAFVCIVLIIRFNILRKPLMGDHDRSIIFISATILLFNLSIAKTFEQYLHPLLLSIKNRI
jgi:hypothetical protein